MKLKSILGFCGCKDCKKKFTCKVELKFKTKKGQFRKKKIRLCDEHTLELCRGGKIKGVTYKNTIDFD